MTAPTAPPVPRTEPGADAVALSDIPTGRPARVVAVLGDALFRERLVELGFTAGQSVSILSRAPGLGPLRVSLRGGAIGLRRDEAACVLVLPEPR